MSTVPIQVIEFLSKKHIAVAGVSRDFQQPANAIYRKLRGAGYQVYAINPNATQVEGGTFAIPIFIQSLNRLKLQ